MLLVVLVGVSLLALDGGRSYSLQTQLQNIADAAALAGASQLNRAPGARARATNAINNLVSNQLAGMDVTSVTLSTPVFYETLPVASQYFSSGTVSPDDGHARFVAVTLTHNMNTIFPVSFLNSGATNAVTAGAQAVAGFDQVACQYTPMFICNPYETNTMTYDQATAALKNATAGSMVALQGAQNAQYAPGNFGWITPPVQHSVSGTCGSGNAVAQAAAQAHPASCFANTSINTHPGNIANTDDALNTRFDLYNASFNNCKGNSLYPPAPNARKGYTPGGSAGNPNYCNPSARWPNPTTTTWTTAPPTGTTGTAMGLPLDNTMTSGLGNGHWNCLTYWNTEHPPGTAGNGQQPTGCTDGTNSISRYSVYQYEISNGYLADKSPGGEVGGGTGLYCSTATPDPNRRILNVAVLNCLNLESEGYSLQGNATNLPVAAFAKFFMTLPVRSAQGPIFAEYVGIAQPGGSNSPFNLVQLYR
jgi:hypothetical protein